jgi:hypothetical protein
MKTVAYIRVSKNDQDVNREGNSGAALQVNIAQEDIPVHGIRNGSPVTWQHINLHGEYDFSDEKLTDSVGLNAPEILAVKEI